MPNPYYHRPIPALPPAESLPFPGNLIRQCSDCALRAGCTAPVPGDGAVPSYTLFCGEAPGRDEDAWGRPFIGKAGRQLDSLLMQCGINREQVYITNTIRCRPPNNRDPKPDETKACAKWLNIELGLVNPRIIVAMGAPAIRWFLQTTDTVEHLHGRPIEKDGRIILPCYHPAAGLHDTSTLRFIYEDFQVLRGLLQGKSVADYTIQDEYPNPDYRVVDKSNSGDFTDMLYGSDCVAVDVETIKRDTQMWSVQLSGVPGTGWFTKIADDYKERFSLRDVPGKIIVHYYLNDIEWLDIPGNNFADTMIFAYLLGLPQGLKELASRLCGMKMASYREVTRPGQQEISLQYLTEAGEREWPNPPELEVTKWDNKEGRIVTRIAKPWHISRKITKMLTDMKVNSDVYLYGRWHKVPDVERACVEKGLGVMPESSLADIPFDDAVRYAVKDADATLRVKLKMEQLIHEAGLDFVLWTDTNILPMVHEMMQTGMVVDLGHLRNLSTEYDARMRAKAVELASVVGHPFNPSSPKQVAEVVYTELGFKPTRTTPTGLVSTDDQELKKTGHPITKGIIEYRRLNKMKGTYADALTEWAVPDSAGIPRVHTTLKTTRVGTGRLASADPNLQNIPTRSKESKLIKSGFIAPEGWLLGEGDLAQIEMCTQAHLANCKGLIDLFLRGADPHTTTASKIFGVSYEDAKQEKYRYPTKRANFGVIYMIGAKGLSEQIAEYISDLEMEGEKVEVEPWTEQECQNFIDEWYRLYPEVRDYQMDMAAMARRYGYVADLFGRRRFIPEVSCPVMSIQESGLRMAANMPVTACLPADTRVTTRSGWLPISELVDGTEVWTGERWAQANKLAMGVHPRVRLYLSDGRTFDCDINHKLLVQTGVWPEWKNVLEIQVDEPLARDKNTDWGLAIGNPEDWFWAGRFIGDGWLSGYATRYQCCWCIAFGHKEVVDGERMAHWLDSKCIGGRNRTDKRGYHYVYDSNNNFKIRGGTKEGQDLWISLGMERKRAREKRIPAIVFTLDRARRRAFLDGYTSADGVTNNNRWQITSASRRLLEDTVRLAESVGLCAWIGEGKTRVYWSNRPSTLWPCYILKNHRDIYIVRYDVLPPESMYTLSVDDERHAFASEGLISKNSAQGIIKLAMGELWRELPKTGWREQVRWLMQIHDSLLIELKEDDAFVREYLIWMRKIMCGVVKLVVPVKVDFKVGKAWGELAKFELEG